MKAERIISTPRAGKILRPRLVRKFAKLSLSALPAIRKPLSAKNENRIE
jgi:hypothetical protein